MAERKPNTLVLILFAVTGWALAFCLIAFMVLLPSRSLGESIELPKTASVSQGDEEPIVIRVTKTGEITIDDKVVELEFLENELRASSEEDFSKRIYIRGVDDADYQIVMNVMARINAAGFSNMGLVTNPADTE